jgi:hypothetical protein
VGFFLLCLFSVPIAPRRARQKITFEDDTKHVKFFPPSRVCVCLRVWPNLFRQDILSFRTPCLTHRRRRPVETVRQTGERGVLLFWPALRTNVLHVCVVVHLVFGGSQRYRFTESTDLPPPQQQPDDKSKRLRNTVRKSISRTGARCSSLSHFGF